MHNESNSLAKAPPVPVEKFGKDHWSLLAYCENQCVNGQGGVGVLSRSRMRCDPDRHPLLACGNPWKAHYTTRLKGFSSQPYLYDVEKATAAGVMLAEHDDWDCLDDLQQHGLVDIVSTANSQVKMTREGQRIAGLLRAHKVSGGNFASFDYTPVTDVA